MLSGKLRAALVCGALMLPVAAMAQDGTPARGVFKTGEQVYADCVSTDAESVARCDWFLMGAHDMASYYQDTDQIEVDFCIPRGTTAETIRKVAVDRWRAQPQSRKYSAVSGLLNALSEKYPGPCKK
ncbi:Rap1a/Tai family immunity protein [Sphingomonas sp. LM7]|uniref:Rap1a/Tai family immunity protein n=1 Tax=Sphingomonas sp. LM7 TaxID=1938607 RepID=UPI0015C53427|nr:Rap1a/Tai family immunity protein [Sphingomonas sp. LM7]